MLMLRNLTLLLILYFGTSLFSIGQEKSTELISAKDDMSLLKNDSLINELRIMLDSMRKPKSFLSVSTSFSNRLFSANNNVFNAQQSSTGATALIPSVSYVHKSGFGFSAMGYIRNINNSVRWYQTALTPSYDKLSKSIMYGVSYSYYLKGNLKDSGRVSPFTHDIYAYIQGRKTWLRPSLSIGYGDGNYVDTYVVPRRMPNGNFQYILDKYNVHIRDLSISMGVSHSFSASSVLFKNDMLSFIPQISIVSGMQSTKTESTTTRERFRNEAEDRKRIESFYRMMQNTGSGFGIRTAAVSANISWFKNALSISTGYFLGYYFQSTSSNKFSNIFNITAGVTF
ncbi:MAG: hypothetical protein RI965_843 [Bacteroidota bacterium]|jgi:hypothetical protein